MARKDKRQPSYFVPIVQFHECRFCGGRGCLACPGEKERLEKKLKENFGEPFLTIRAKFEEDPVGWEILQKGMHREVVEKIYAQCSDPETAGVVLHLHMMKVKSEILEREAKLDQRDSEHALARFEGEGGSLTQEEKARG